MPRRKAEVFTCPDCGLQVALTRNTATVKRKKSEKRVRLAKNRRRDPVTGRFLPGKKRRKGKEREEGTSKRFRQRSFTRNI